MARKASQDDDLHEQPLIVRRKLGPRDNFSVAHLAQTIGKLLSDGVSRTAKEIARDLSRQQNYPIKESSVNKSLAYGEKHFEFRKLPNGRWTVGSALMPSK